MQSTTSRSHCAFSSGPSTFPIDSTFEIMDTAQARSPAAPAPFSATNLRAARSATSFITASALFARDLSAMRTTSSAEFMSRKARAGIRSARSASVIFDTPHDSSIAASAHFSYASRKRASPDVFQAAA